MRLCLTIKRRERVINALCVSDQNAYLRLESIEEQLANIIFVN